MPMRAEDMKCEELMEVHGLSRRSSKKLNNENTPATISWMKHPRNCQKTQQSQKTSRNHTIHKTMGGMDISITQQMQRSKKKQLEKSGNSDNS